MEESADDVDIAGYMTALKPTSMDSITSGEARRTRRKTEQTVDVVSSPTSPLEEGNSDKRRRRRTQRRESENSDTVREDAQPIKQEAGRTGRRKRRSRTNTTKSLVIKSPIGDETITLDPQDFSMATENDYFTSAGLMNVTLSRPTTPGLPTTSQTVLPTSNDIVIIQEKGRFRQTTRQELQLRTLANDKQGVQAQFGSQSDEAQINLLVKKIQVYSLAFSYLAYGTLAGMGLCCVILFPIVSPVMTPVLNFPQTGALALLRYTSSPFIAFFDYYSPYAMTISNTFSILTIIVLVHALETRSHAVQAKQKLMELDQVHVTDPAPPQGQIGGHQDSYHKKEWSQVKKRLRTSSIVVLFTFAAFISNAIVKSVDEKWYDAATSNDLFVTSNGLQFKLGPYPVIDKKTAFIPANQNLPTLDWFWQYAATTSSIPDDLRKDVLLWTICNLIRGLASMLSLISALLEIRFRTYSKKKSAM